MAGKVAATQTLQGLSVIYSGLFISWANKVSILFKPV